MGQTVKLTITFQDLEKIDVRVGTIEKVENVTNSDKLVSVAGEISEGMVFDIGYADGIVPVLAVPEKPVPNGARAG